MGGPGEDPLSNRDLPPATAEPLPIRVHYYAETRPDELGYVATIRQGSSISSIAANRRQFSHQGASLSQPSRWIRDGSSWRRATRRGIQVATLRNGDKRPYRPSMMKAYMHNGYFTSPEGDRALLQPRATYCRAASPMTSVKVRHCGRRGVDPGQHEKRPALGA